MDYGKDLDLTLQGHFINNQGAMDLFVQNGRAATLNAGHQASMLFNNMTDNTTGFYKPLIKINNAQNLTKNTERVLVGARNIDDHWAGVQGVSCDAVFASNANLQEPFKERLALYSNNTRMGICAVQKGNANGIKACRMAIGDHDMISNPNHYKYPESQAWKNTSISKTANNAKTSVRLGNNSMPSGHDNNTKELPTNNRQARFVSHALIKNAPLAKRLS